MRESHVIVILQAPTDRAIPHTFLTLFQFFQKPEVSGYNWKGIQRGLRNRRNSWNVSYSSRRLRLYRLWIEMCERAWLTFPNTSRRDLHGWRFAYARDELTYSRRTPQGCRRTTGPSSRSLVARETRRFVTPVWLSTRVSRDAKRRVTIITFIPMKSHISATAMKELVTRRAYLHTGASLDKITHLHRCWAPPWSRISAKRRILPKVQRASAQPCAIVYGELSRGFGAAFNCKRKRASHHSESRRDI